MLIYFIFSFLYFIVDYVLKGDENMFIIADLNITSLCILSNFMLESASPNHLLNMEKKLSTAHLYPTISFWELSVTESSAHLLLPIFSIVLTILSRKGSHLILVVSIDGNYNLAFFLTSIAGDIPFVCKNGKMRDYHSQHPL